MANLLKVVMVETILSLHRRGWSGRRIARELGIDRETVARHVRLAADNSKPANAPTGSEPGDAGSNPANAPTGSDPPTDDPNPAKAPIGSGATEPANASDAEAGRFSICAPWREAIRSKLELGLTAQRVFQDLVAEHGFTGSYYSVRRFIRRLDGKRELPFRRLECAPGEEAQEARSLPPPPRR